MKLDLLGHNPFMNRRAEFEENLKNSRNALMSFILSKINKSMDVEDVFQRASMIMWNKYDLFDSTTNFISWACTIAFYESRNYCRSFIRCPISFDSEIYDKISLNQIFEDRQDNKMYDKLYNALSELDEESRNLLIGVYANGEEAKDLAKKAGKSPQTYYNKLNIAKKKIMEKLK